MKEQLLNLVTNTKKYISKHSPEILTGLGVAGMISATVCAVTATPKALQLIELKKEELKTDKLTPVETIKAAWKPYIPTTILTVVSASCIIGASTVRYKRNTALATAYAVSENTLLRYRDKVVETLGEKKEKDIRNKVDQDIVNETKNDNTAIIVTSKGNTLCLDKESGRYFKSDLDTIEKAVNKLNRDLVYQQYVSLNSFYGEIGLDDVKSGELRGWNLDSGLIEVDYSTCLAPNDEPCIVIDFLVGPRYDFDKLM